MGPSVPITSVNLVGLKPHNSQSALDLDLQGRNPPQGARSSPLVIPTLACPHASLPPYISTYLLQLPSSVITPHSFVPGLCPPALHVLLCPRHGAVWSETACCLFPRVQYIGRATNIIVGHDCFTPPASSSGLSHAWTFRVSHSRMLLISALNGRAS